MRHVKNMAGNLVDLKISHRFIYLMCYSYVYVLQKKFNKIWFTILYLFTRSKKCYLRFTLRKIKEFCECGD